MYKKFVPLTSTQSPSRNPYEIRTFMGDAASPGQEWHTDVCVYQRNCDAIENSTMDKVLTLQDEIRKIHQKTQENLFRKSFSKKCKYAFTSCVVPQRTPEQLRLHALMCENTLKVKQEQSEVTEDIGNLYSGQPSTVELIDPIEAPKYRDAEATETKESELVTPELATPECSRKFIYLPPKNLLSLKRQKSGVFVNETERQPFSLPEDISYSTYNPRELQEQFDAQNLKNIDLIPGKYGDNLWTWNVGMQRKEAELDRMFIEAAVPKFDCNHVELAYYELPKDVDKTFSASITFATKAIAPQPIPKKKPRYVRPVEMGCLYIAFVESFRLNADFWTAQTLDNIMEMGKKLIEKSTKLNYKSTKNDYDIITFIEERQASLNLKAHFAGPLKSEPNIYKALSIYFSKYNACILCSNKLYLLIWKRCKNFFYVYDPNGRTENGTRDFTAGKSALLSTQFVEHLVHYIVNISQTNLEDEFKLYEIYLTSFGRITEPIITTPFPKIFHKRWAVINDSFAVIPGCNNGLLQPTTSAMDNASMLISVMAILYSHIERPNTWKTSQVDELIRLGTAYYKSLRRLLDLTDLQHVTVTDLPDKYVLGYFKASLKKAPFMFTGTVTDFCKQYKDSLLTSGMKELFDNNWEAALLQIDNSVLAIWRDNELFYVYDPFRRSKSGQVLDPDDYRTQGAAILQIHSNIESLLRILYEKALKMRRGGKFFIHAINVGCIKPILDGKQRKLRYPKLKLTAETYAIPSDDLGQGDTPAEGAADKKEKKGKKSKKSKEKEKKAQVLKVCSIESLNEEERTICFRSTEIVLDILNEVVCDVLQKLPEPIIGRPKLYKSAARVLLRSDKEYLENLKYMTKREEDLDNMDASVFTEPETNIPMMTLEEELKLPTNFEALPDGTWIIFGTGVVHHTDEEQFKLTGLLSSLVTAILSVRYKISTWNTALVDHALESVNIFGENYQVYQYALGGLLHNTIPKILMGYGLYQVSLDKVFRSDLKKSLRQILIEALVNSNRILVICQRFSCLIVKRYNFLYLFCGFPVNAVGFRKRTPGPACIMRFVELDSVIRRIEYGCNPYECDVANYIVLSLQVVDISNLESRYRNWPEDVEGKMYSAALAEKTRLDESYKSKLRFLEEELGKEDRRIEKFQSSRAEKTEGSAPKTKTSEETVKGVTDSKVDMEEGESHPQDIFKDECVEDAKHTFDDSETDTGKDSESLKPRPVVYGYRLREKDLLYKIQGSKVLQDRSTCVSDKIKPCLFASALAILYTILKPLNEWTSHRIDQVIDSTLILKEKIKSMDKVPERVIRNISVDDYIFEIVIKEHKPLGLKGNLQRRIQRVLTFNKYFILQTENCSYAITKDNYYHLFDPYPSMEKMPHVEEEAGQKENADNENEAKDDSKEKQKILKRKLLKSIKRYGERNTASWILFADVATMVNYIHDRSCTKTWRQDKAYTFVILEVISFKKAPQSAFLLQLLTGMQTCNVHDEQETAICAYNETTAWLDHCLPIWSRLNRRNAAGRYRGMAVTRAKEYDIEIENRLWSLWGSLHPKAPVFDISTRGKQYLACCVMSLCAASFYRLVDWSSHFLDSIVVNGDRYMQQSLNTITCEDYQLYLEDLNTECMLENMTFDAHIEIVAYGVLYANPTYNRLNLAEALMYFFNYFQFGILQCFKKCLAVGFIPGYDGGYFMFDCQSRGNPIFPKGQGASYILRTKYLQILLYCIVVTLNIPYYNVQFTLHKVNFQYKNPQGGQTEETKQTEQT